MRDWFAAFAREQSRDTLEIRATEATGATPELTNCETYDFYVARDVAQVSNRWATRATPEADDKAENARAAGGTPVAHVAQSLPKESPRRAMTENEKYQDLTSAVAPVAHQIDDEAGDPTRCAHCGGGERSGAPVFPIGTAVIGHTWLHTECWRAWYTKRHPEPPTKAMGAGEPP